jgi:hypothetical protein
MLNKNLYSIKNNFCILIIALFGFFLPGCETPRISPQSLSPVNSKTIVILKLGKEYSYISKLSFGKVNKTTLMPGDYTAEFSGRDGIYYKGPLGAVRSIVMDNQNGVVQYLNGGVVVPSDDKVAAKIYIYTGLIRPSQPYDPVKGVEVPREPLPSEAPKANLIDTATNIAVPPTATPGQTLSGGISAGIGAAIVQAMIKADEGKIVIPESQPIDRGLREAFGL